MRISQDHHFEVHSIIARIIILRSLLLKIQIEAENTWFVVISLLSLFHVLVDLKTLLFVKVKSHIINKLFASLKAITVMDYLC